MEQPPVLDPAVVEFIHGGVAVGVATRDDDLPPEFARGWGPEVSADGRSLRGCVTAPGEGVSEEFQITAGELKEKIDDGNVVLLDVREPLEWEIAHLDGATLMPVAQVPNRVNELSTADEIVVYCKTGVRSARITNFLREMGFRKVKNLEGGIDAWADEVDPAMPRY